MTFLNSMKWITYSVVLIGALNWGLIGAFNFDLISYLFGDMTILSRAIYSLVGLCAIGYFILSYRDSECTSYNC